jgi:hypothetical protein
VAFQRTQPSFIETTISPFTCIWNQFTYKLRWFILSVHLTGWRDAQIAGKTLFLGVHVRVSFEENSIWISRARVPSLTNQASSNTLRTCIQQKPKEGWILSSSCSIHLPLSSNIKTPGPQALDSEPLSSSHPSFSGHQPPTGSHTTGSSDSLVCKQQMVELFDLHNHKIIPKIHLFTCTHHTKSPICCFSGELWNKCVSITGINTSGNKHWRYYISILHCCWER